MGAPMWTATDDVIVKVGKAWVRRSAVLAVKPDSIRRAGSIILMTANAQVVVADLTPDQVIARLWKKAE